MAVLKNAIIESVLRVVGKVYARDIEVSGSLVINGTDIVDSVNTGKTNIANAITYMGVTTASSATFATMVTNIKAITPSISITGSWTASNGSPYFTYSASTNINTHNTVNTGDQTTTLTHVNSGTPSWSGLTYSGTISSTVKNGSTTLSTKNVSISTTLTHTLANQTNYPYWDITKNSSSVVQNSATYKWADTSLVKNGSTTLSTLNNSGNSGAVAISYSSSSGSWSSLTYSWSANAQAKAGTTLIAQLSTSGSTSLTHANAGTPSWNGLTYSGTISSTVKNGNTTLSTKDVSISTTLTHTNAATTNYPYWSPKKNGTTTANDMATYFWDATSLVKNGSTTLSTKTTGNNTKIITRATAAGSWTASNGSPYFTYNATSNTYNGSVADANLLATYTTSSTTSDQQKTTLSHTLANQTNYPYWDITKNSSSVVQNSATYKWADTSLVKNGSTTLSTLNNSGNSGAVAISYSSSSGSWSSLTYSWSANAQAKAGTTLIAQLGTSGSTSLTHANSGTPSWSGLTYSGTVSSTVKNGSTTLSTKNVSISTTLTHANAGTPSWSGLTYSGTVSSTVKNGSTTLSTKNVSISTTLVHDTSISCSVTTSDTTGKLTFTASSTVSIETATGALSTQSESDWVRTVPDYCITSLYSTSLGSSGKKPTNANSDTDQSFTTTSGSFVSIRSVKGYHSGNSRELYVAASEFGNVAAEKVASGYKFTSSDGVNISGTMKSAQLKNTWGSNPPVICKFNSGNAYYYDNNSKYYAHATFSMNRYYRQAYSTAKASNGYWMTPTTNNGDFGASYSSNVITVTNSDSSVDAGNNPQKRGVQFMGTSATCYANTDYMAIFRYKVTSTGSSSRPLKIVFGMATSNATLMSPTSSTSDYKTWTVYGSKIQIVSTSEHNYAKVEFRLTSSAYLLPAMLMMGDGTVIFQGCSLYTIGGVS